MINENRTSLIDRVKLFYTPMLIGTFILVAISIVGYQTTRHMLINQMKLDGTNLAHQIVQQVQGNEHSVRLANQLMKEHIRSANLMALDNRAILSDEYLTRLAQITFVDEITWYSSDGQILHASENSPRRPVSAGDILYDFMRGREMEIMEPVQYISIKGDNYQYGAMKHTSGEFVQSGIMAAGIMNLTRQFSYQSLVSQIVDNENILYARILNSDYMAIADSNLADIGYIYNPEINSALKNAFSGEIAATELFDDTLGNNVIKVTVPLFIDNQTNHTLIFAMSMETLYDYLYQSILIFILTVFALMVLYMFFLTRNIVRPINELDSAISCVDTEKQISYRLQLKSQNPFFGLAETINQALDKTEQYFISVRQKQQDLETSHQEIEEAYQQIQDSKEALNKQLSYSRHQAYHDDLTQLPNRRYFMEKLTECINEGQHGSVIIMDADNFKTINDTMGHPFGDQVLRRMGQELENILGDKVFLSRFGGDEFLILLDKQPDSNDAENIALQIRNHFSQYFLVHDQNVLLTLSMGIVNYPEDGREPEKLIMNADLALHRAKTMGKNNFLFFDDSMTKLLTEKARIEEILRKALTNEDFILYYQPKINLLSNKPSGFEALLRLNDFSVSPGDFIPIAEEMGLIQAIGRWVTKAVIRQIADWKDQGLSVLPVSINFSALQLRDFDYVDFLKRELVRMDIAPQLIEIEITENIFLETKEEALTFLYQLRDLGVSISIDDFGTGFSSLSYLTLLPVNIVKLDKTLIDRYLEESNQVVISSIISLIHSLKLKVVAEGVEKKIQLEQLAACQCDYVQGFYISKPIPPEDLKRKFL